MKSLLQIANELGKTKQAVYKRYRGNSHSAIIPQDTYDLVQSEITRRAKLGKRMTGNDNPFTGKIICGECGAFLGPRVWRNRNGDEKVVWQCKNRNSRGKCAAPYIIEPQIQEAFIEAYNRLLGNKTRYIKRLKPFVGN